jgi:hypothetical protein
VHVHLQHVRAQFDRVVEGGEGVTRPQPFAALVGDHHWPVGFKEGPLGRIWRQKGQDNQYDDDCKDKYKHPTAETTHGSKLSE